MRLTAEEVSKVESILEEFKETKEAEIMKRCIQHGRISTYDHVCSVALLSFYLNRRFHLGASDSEVVRAAFLVCLADKICSCREIFTQKDAAVRTNSF